MKSDYEDLLVLLEDQDIKIDKYKVCWLVLIKLFHYSTFNFVLSICI